MTMLPTLPYGSECFVERRPFDEVRYSAQRLRIVGYHTEITDLGTLRILSRTFRYVTSLTIINGCVDQAEVTNLVHNPQ